MERQYQEYLKEPPSGGTPAGAELKQSKKAPVFIISGDGAEIKENFHK